MKVKPRHRKMHFQATGEYADDTAIAKWVKEHTYVVPFVATIIATRLITAPNREAAWDELNSKLTAHFKASTAYSLSGIDIS